MKTKQRIRSKIVAGILTMVLVGHTTTQADFDSYAYLPNPQVGSWLGDADVYWGYLGGNYGKWGWTFARYSGPTEKTLHFHTFGYDLSNNQVCITSCDAIANFTYKVEEYYFDADDFNYGESEIAGWDGYGYAAGSVWDNTP